MIDSAVLIGLDIFAALKVEAQQHGNAGIARPEDFSLSMMFLNRHRDPPWFCYTACGSRTPRTLFSIFIRARRPVQAKSSDNVVGNAKRLYRVTVA
jgi:hypothetical protein